jgi:hypothetical protein
MIVQALLVAFATYLLCGCVFAIAFVLVGVKRMDPHAAQGSWGFRLLIIPGAVFLWPLLAKRWLSGAHEPPEENNSHRRAVRLPLSPQRGEGRGEGWECSRIAGEVERSGQHHPSPSIPLPVEGRGKLVLTRLVEAITV